MICPEITYTLEQVQKETPSKREAYVPPYRLLLREPTVLLAGNHNDRPDVATAAILGYN